MPGGNKAGGGLKTKQSAFYLRSGNKPSPLEFFQGDMSRARMYNPGSEQEDVTEGSRSEIPSTDYNQEKIGVGIRPDRMSSVSRERMFAKPNQAIGGQNLSQNYTNTQPVEESINNTQDMQDIPIELMRGSGNADAIAAAQASTDPYGVKRKKRNPGYLGSNV